MSSVSYASFTSMRYGGIWCLCGVWCGVVCVCVTIGLCCARIAAAYPRLVGNWLHSMRVAERKARSLEIPGKWETAPSCPEDIKILSSSENVELSPGRILLTIVLLPGSCINFCLGPCWEAHLNSTVTYLRKMKESDLTGNCLPCLAGWADLPDTLYISYLLRLGAMKPAWNHVNRHPECLAPGCQRALRLR